MCIVFNAHDITSKNTFKKNNHQYYATSSTFLENANKNYYPGPAEGGVSRILRTALYTIWDRLTNETILNSLTFFKKFQSIMIF